MKRDNITIEEAVTRSNAQHDQDFFKKNCDFIVKNNGEDIEEQIDNILEVIL